jgi:L-ribulose-5-phosphate 3-epimerase
MTTKKALMLTDFFTSTAVQKATPVAESIALALAEGSSHIYIEGSSDEDHANNWNADKLKKVKSQLVEHSLSAIVHGNYRNPICHQIKDIREAAKLYICKEIDLARELDAPLIVHASCLFTHSNLAQLRRTAMSDFTNIVNELNDYAQSQGVTLWLENLEHYQNRRPFYTLFSMFEQYRRVFSEVDPAVKFILDLGHENISSDHPHETLAYFIDRIVAVSVSNNDGSVDSHSPLDQGTLDYQKVIEVLKTHGWKGHLSVETKKGGLQEALLHLHAATAQTRKADCLVS